MVANNTFLAKCQILVIFRKCHKWGTERCIRRKVHGPILKERKKERKKKVSVSFEESSLQRCKFKVEPVKPFGCTKHLYITVVPLFYCVSLVTVTITRHIFIIIFQMECFSPVKFAIGYEKNMSFLVNTKISKSLKKVKKKDRTGLL